MYPGSVTLNTFLHPDIGEPNRNGDISNFVHEPY